MNANTGQRNVQGRTVYRGAKGGLYVLAAPGKKKYKPVMAGPAPVAASAAGNTGMTNVQGRRVYRGPKGGLYVLVGGKKQYKPTVATAGVAARASAAEGLLVNGLRVHRGPKGGWYVIKGGRKKYVKAPQSNLAGRVVASALARRVANVSFAAAAVSSAKKTSKKAERRRPPLGMGVGSGVRGPWLLEPNGTKAIDPVSLNHIPMDRAVRVGRQVFDSRTLRALLRRDPGAVNPLTREPFPEDVRRAYGDQSGRMPEALAKKQDVSDAVGVIVAAIAREAPPGLHMLSPAVFDDVERRYGVRVALSASSTRLPRGRTRVFHTIVVFKENFRKIIGKEADGTLQVTDADIPDYAYYA